MCQEWLRVSSWERWNLFISPPFPPPCSAPPGQADTALQSCSRSPHCQRESSTITEPFRLENTSKNPQTQPLGTQHSPWMDTHHLTGAVHRLSHPHSLWVLLSLAR